MMALRLFIKKIFLYRRITKDFINHNSIFFKKVKKSKKKKNTFRDKQYERFSYCLFLFIKCFVKKI